MKTINNIITVAGGGIVLLAAAASYAGKTEVQTQARGTVLAIPSDQAAKVAHSLPHRSMTKSVVRRTYGEPQKIHAPVGDPPITRWDYPGFRVFFEYDLVLHAVVPGEFPPIDHRKQLISGN